MRQEGLSRRQLLRRGAAAGAAGVGAWAAPAIVQTAAAGAAAASAPGGGGCTARGIIFFDDFSEEGVKTGGSSALNYYPFNLWYVANNPVGGSPPGSVDLIRPGDFFNASPFWAVDLDGSTGEAGRLILKDGANTLDASGANNDTTDARPAQFPGFRYKLSFDFTNPDPQNNDTFVGFGELPAVPVANTIGTQTLDYVATSAGKINLFFQNRFLEGSADDQGPYLTNVIITEFCVAG
jgi:hypothetical protein